MMKKLFLNTLIPGLLLSLVGCAQDPTNNRGVEDPGMAGGTGLPAMTICKVPEPAARPSSAFSRFQSISREHSGYWVRYTCREECQDWRQCLAPAYADDGGALLSNGRHPQRAKQALAFVVDGMAGHLALSDTGSKTVFIHTGAGGTRYYAVPAATLEKQSSARTVMIRWEKGYTSPLVQAPFTDPVSWGWYSRTSAEPTNIRELNKRVASVMNWVHENLAGEAEFATLGCSMGTNATFGPVLWHGLDPIVDYQLFVGGPNMWDLNAQCDRREYGQGFCAIDGVSTCRTDADCNHGRCTIADNYTTIDRLFEQLPNHMHVTDACDVSADAASSPPYPPFDESSMGYAPGADWTVDHRVDFLVNLDAEQGATMAQGLGGDEYWALGHFPHVYDSIKPDHNKRWMAYPNSHHCDAMFDEALDVLTREMGL